MRLLLLLILLFACSAAHAVCDQTFSNTTGLVTAVTNAANGETICLNDGTYSGLVFSNITGRTGYVTVQSTSGTGALLSDPHFSNSRYIEIKNVQMEGGWIRACGKNLKFTGVLWNQTTGFEISNYNDTCSNYPLDITIDGATFGDVIFPLSEGRLDIRDKDISQGSMGITIKNSSFGPGGQSDGIQLTGGASGVTIGPGNYFHDMIQIGGGIHCDAIQLFGATNNATIDGNFFSTNTSVLTAHSAEIDNMTWTDNVVVGGGESCALQIGSGPGHYNHNFVFEHNTHYGCAGATTNALSSTDVTGIVRNNVYVSGGMDNIDGNCTSCDYSYNVYYNSGACEGTNCLTTEPTFLGGTPPFTFANWADWECTGGSCESNGSDSLDRGTLYYGTDVPTDHNFVVILAQLALLAIGIGLLGVIYGKVSHRFRGGASGAAARDVHQKRNEQAAG